MNYEKAYKEALERAKNLRKDAIDMGENIRAKQCEIIFPELKEDEDEKIRKWLIDTIKSVPNDSIEWDVINKSDVLAWLEKQGEQKVPVIDFKAKDWYVSKVDGKIYNAKFMEKTPINQARKLEIEKAAMSATGIIEQEEWFIKGAEWSDKNPSYISSDKSVKVKGFVAVDNCGDKTIYNPTGRRVAFFPKKPVRDLLTNNHYWAAHISPYDVINLGYEDFPELKWEDEPVEVEITINKVMEAKVIIEINGVRHYMVRGRNNVDPCSKCSLEKHCTKIIGSPCLSPYDYFKKVEE